MKREKRLTKRERKALEPAGTSGVKPKATANAGQAQQTQPKHIHCIACGKHLDAEMFGEPNGAEFLRCNHGTDFAHCVGCKAKATELVEEHDRTNTPVKSVALWH